MNLGPLIQGLGTARLGYSQGRNKQVSANREREDEVQQLMFKLALEKSAREQTQSNSDRSFGLLQNADRRAAEKATYDQSQPKPTPPLRLGDDGYEDAMLRLKEAEAKISAQYRENPVENAVAIAQRTKGIPTYSDLHPKETSETITLPDGTVVQGKPAKITEAQGKAAVTTNVAESEEGSIEAMKNNLGQKYVNKIPVIGNILTGQNDAKYQAQVAAGERWINQYLRFQSGAAISQSEFDNARKQFIPQPGDKPETVAAKAAARKRVVEGMRNAAGPALRNTRNPTPTAVSSSDDLDDADYYEMLRSEGIAHGQAVLKIEARRHKGKK